MVMPLIISFYTPDWLYPKHAARLKRECQRLNLRYRIEPRKSAGGYLQNTCIKPYFIREMLKSSKRPVLWIDVDGSILKRPIFCENLSVDFAARKMPIYRKKIWHVGTMFFNYSANALNLVDRWCEEAGSWSDETALDNVWKRDLEKEVLSEDDFEKTLDLTFTEIPRTYFELARKASYKPTSQTVIYHRISNGPSKRAQFAKKKANG